MAHQQHNQRVYPSSEHSGEETMSYPATSPTQHQPPQYQNQPHQHQQQQQQQQYQGNLQRSYRHEIALQNNQQNAIYEGCTNGCGGFCGFIGMFPCMCCFPNPFQTVEQGSVGLVTRFGRYYKSVDPGLVQINVYTERLQRVEIKVNIQPIPQQVVMTKDNVSIAIDSVIYWEVYDPYIATFLVSDVRKALMERTQTTLRHVIGTRNLQDSIENRDTVASDILAIIEEPARSWGVKVESILIKDIQFSADLQESLAAAAKQKRIGESKIIIARAEVESAKLMREAADVLNTKAAMQIRYLETLASISSHPGTKVIFMPPGTEK